MNGQRCLFRMTFGGATAREQRGTCFNRVTRCDHADNGLSCLCADHHDAQLAKVLQMDPPLPRVIRETLPGLGVSR